MSLAKQNIFKFFLFIFLAFKLSLCVYEVFPVLNTTDQLVQVDFDEQSENESEKDNTEKKDVDEKEFVAVVSNASIDFTLHVIVTNYLDSNKTYQTQYLEFTTPPPEFL